MPLLRRVQFQVVCGRKDHDPDGQRRSYAGS